MHTQTDPHARLLRYLQASPELQARIEAILDGREPERPATAKGPLLLGMSAASTLLGCSRATLWRLCKAGKLARIELLPGSFRVRRADIEALAAGKEVVS